MPLFRYTLTVVVESDYDDEREVVRTLLQDAETRLPDDMKVTRWDLTQHKDTL